MNQLAQHRARIPTLHVHPLMRGQGAGSRLAGGPRQEQGGSPWPAAASASASATRCSISSIDHSAAASADGATTSPKRQLGWDPTACARASTRERAGPSGWRAFTSTTRRPCAPEGRAAILRCRAGGRPTLAGGRHHSPRPRAGVPPPPRVPFHKPGASRQRPSFVTRFRRFRARPESLLCRSAACQPRGEHLDDGEDGHCGRGVDQPLEVLGEPPIASQPGEGALDDPSCACWRMIRSPKGMRPAGRRGRLGNRWKPSVPTGRSMIWSRSCSRAAAQPATSPW